MKKKILLGIVGFIVVALAGAYFYITTMDWNKHKDKFASHLSAITGKTVVFQGPLSLELFPSPYLVAKNIKVFNNGDRENPLASISQIVANVSFSSIMGGDIKVERMSLIEPEISFVFDEDGKLNWVSPITQEQQEKLSGIQVSLDSVTVERANVRLVSKRHEIDWNLEKLNAEIIASSIFGPYDIEGSYMRSGKPEGFAIKLGSYSESFGLGVSFVLNQPASETSFHFEGNVVPNNDALNGSITIESQKPAVFLYHTFSRVVPKEFNIPLELNLELNSNAQQMSLNNVVFKFGRTTGAGNVLVPFDEENDINVYDEEEASSDRRKVEIGFDMTEFDLEPMAVLIDNIIERYSEKDAVFSSNLGFDLWGDIKSLRTYYKGEVIEEFALSFDLMDDTLSVKSLEALFPGNTLINVKGDIFPSSGVLTYNFDNSLTTTDLERFMRWLGYNVPVVAESTYKRATATFGLAGNLGNIKIAPLALNVDKMSVNGEMGIVRGDRKNIYVNLSADTINFDNYISAMPAEEAAKSFDDRLRYKFGRVAFLKDADVRGSVSLGLGIYESIAFENTKASFVLKSGEMNFEDISIGSLANAKMNFSGIVKGFGGEPLFNNLRYSVETLDLVSFLNKFEIEQPRINLKEMKKFSSKGVYSGDLENGSVKALSRFEGIEHSFDGNIVRKDGKLYFDGDMELKASDFVRFVNNMGYNYAPNVFNLGLLSVKGKFVGSRDKFQADNLNVNVGSNNFQGVLGYDNTTERPSIVTNLAINKFEIDRFFYNYIPGPRNEKKIVLKPDDEIADFLAKPLWDKTKINYDFYKGFDFKGKFKVTNLSYKAYAFRDAGFDLNLTNGVAKLQAFSAGYQESSLNGDAEMDITARPIVKGKAKLTNKTVKDFGGRKYALNGVMSGDVEFSSDASSEDEFMRNMSAKTNFSFKNVVIKGWDFDAIKQDLEKRDRSDGFLLFVNEALQRGETPFDDFSGYFNIEKGLYNIASTSFSRGKTTVEMKANGDINVWDVTSDFKVVLGDLEKASEFNFSLSGLLSSPNLSANVDFIASGFDAYWAKVEADRDAAVRTRLDRLNMLMREQQNIAVLAKSELDALRGVLNLRKEASISEKILQIYERTEAKINELNSSIEEIFALGKTVDFDDALIEDIVARNKVINEKIVEIRDDISRVYAQDVKTRLSEEYNKISDIYSSSKEIATVYRDRYVEYPKKFAGIETVYKLDQDEYVLGLKDEIEKKILEIDSIYAKVAKDYIFVQNSNDMEKIEEYLLVTGEALGTSDVVMKDLVLATEKLFGYLDEVLMKEDADYQKKKYDEELQRKIEENTGKIQTSTGKSKIVVRDVEEIISLEEEIKEENIRVLDFSKPTSGAKGVIRKAGESEKTSDNKENFDGNNLLKPSGEVQKATGVIIKN